MSSPLVRWLLDLDSIPEGSETLRLVWERPWPAWMWLILVLLAFTLAIWSYSRLTGSRVLRGGLAVLRAGVLVLLLILLSGPMLELPRESIEEDRVLILVDRSASMSIADAGSGRTRETQLREILDRHRDLWTTMAEEREVHWFGFHSAAFAMEMTPEGQVDLGEATGTRTDITTALEQILQRSAARPVSGIILLSDGRTAQAPDRALLRRLQSDAIEVYSIPLGSPDPLGDLGVARIDAPRRAFIHDQVPVVVEIDRFGSAVSDVGGTVRLRDDLTGDILDEVRLEPGEERDFVTLTAEPTLVGEANWSVEIETDRPDLVSENNRKRFVIELVDRPLRLLYIDGYSRWEYRYLKNLVIREASIDSSVVLLSADRDFAQEGNTPVTRLPHSAEEWSRYDVIVVGDVPATFFSSDQLEMMREHVAVRGAGLLWIGGERHTPESYTGLALADLLPMRGALTLPVVRTGINLEPTELADRLGVLRINGLDRLGWPDELRDPSYTWSRLWFVQRIDPKKLKPTAEILAQSTAPVDGTVLPLVVHMRYGAGQSIYVATDEIWRWRYGRGEYYPDQFWIQMIRMLGRDSLELAGSRAVLQVHPRRVEVGTPAQLVLRVFDQQMIDERQTSIHAEIWLNDEQISELELRRPDGADAEFVSTLIPDHAGTLDIRINDPAIPTDQGLVASLEVFGRNDERRRPETDHSLLKRLAEETGGRMLDPENGDLETLELPNREVRTSNPLRERIWDTPLFFGLLLLLLSLEWVGRKIARFA